MASDWIRLEHFVEQQKQRCHHQQQQAQMQQHHHHGTAVPSAFTLLQQQSPAAASTIAPQAVPSLCSPSSGIGAVGTGTASSSSQLHQHQHQHRSPLSSSSSSSTTITTAPTTATTAHNHQNHHLHHTPGATTTVPTVATTTTAAAAGCGAVNDGGTRNGVNADGTGTVTDRCCTTSTTPGVGDQQQQQQSSPQQQHHHQPVVKKIRRRRPKEDKLLMPRRASLPQGVMVKSDGGGTVDPLGTMMSGPCSVGSITVMDELNGGIVKMEGVVEQHQQQQQQQQFQSQSVFSNNSNTNTTSNESISSGGGGGGAETCAMPSSAREAQCQHFVQQMQQSSPPALLHEHRRQAATMVVEDMNTLMECDDEGVVGDQRQKHCRVCGDSATGYNFNVISCESCKAFFRRNALRPKEFKCPYSNECEITALTRRFCQKCRLRKCFDVGMKKEWILSDEQLKRRKNARIKCQQQQQQQQQTNVKEGQQHNNNNSSHNHQHPQQQQLTPTTTPVSSVASSGGATGGAVHTPGSVGSAIGGVGGTPNCFDSATSTPMAQQPPLPSTTVANNGSHNSFSPPQNLFYHNSHSNNSTMAAGVMAQPHNSPLATVLNHNSNNSATGASPLALAALSALMAGASPGGGGQLSTAENSPLGSAIAAIANSPRGGGAASALSCFDANKVSPCSVGVQSPPPILPVIDPNQHRQFLTQQQQLLFQTVLQATTGGNAATLANAAMALARGGHTQQAVAALQQLQQQQQFAAQHQQNITNNSSNSSAGLSPLIIDQCHRLMMLGQQQQQYSATATTVNKGSPPTASSLIKSGSTVTTAHGAGGNHFYHNQQRQQISPTTAATVHPVTPSYGSGAADATGTELPPTTPTSTGAGAGGISDQSPSMLLAHFQRMNSLQNSSEALQRHIQNTVQDELNMAQSPPADPSPSSRSTPTGTMPPFISPPFQPTAVGLSTDQPTAVFNAVSNDGTNGAGGTSVPTSSASSCSAASSPNAMGAATNAVPSMALKDLRAFQLNSLELRDVEAVKAAFSLLEDEFRKSATSNMPNSCKSIDELMLLLETMLRRMVKVIKKLPAFIELTPSGRFALMKGAIIDMLTVRGALSVDVAEECWKRSVMSSSEIRLNFNILDQLLNGNMQTRRVTDFYKQLHQTLMKDQMANNLVILIMMFNHHIDTDLSAEDKSITVKHHVMYAELLKRYLESIYGPEEARQIYETVPKAFVMLTTVTEKAKELFRGRVPTEAEKQLKNIKLAAEIFPAGTTENGITDGAGNEPHQRQGHEDGKNGDAQQQQQMELEEKRVPEEDSGGHGTVPTKVPKMEDMLMEVKQEQQDNGQQ